MVVGRFLCTVCAVALIASFTVSIANQADKILVGPRIGSATIISIVGINSDKAVVQFRRELEDSVESCIRNIGSGDSGVPDAGRVAECLRHEESAGRPIMTRRAFCSRNTVYTEIGNFSLVNAQREPDSMIDGKPYKSIKSDWKDHRNEQIVGNCSACGTPVILDTFRILCPRAYRGWFEDAEPH